MIKWFKINKKTKIFGSKKVAKTLTEAWDKTIQKWELILDGYMVDGITYTCGLCDLYANQSCRDCLICIVSGESYCKGTPFVRWRGFSTQENAEMEYLYLLFVKEATK